MTHIGKVTIETVPRQPADMQQLKTTVEIGGSLVTVDCTTDQYPDLGRLVEQLYDALATLALEELRTSLHEPEP